MEDLRGKIDDLVELMEEFGLESARLSGEDWSVSFSSQDTGHFVALSGVQPSDSPAAPRAPSKRATAAPVPTGTPVTSPTTGIFYSSPNPGAPPFVKVGDTVEAGQVIGLIEAMKVFNEITATVSGTVQQVQAHNGQLVQPGDVLLRIG